MEVLFKRTTTHPPKTNYNIEVEQFTRPKPNKKPNGFHPFWLLFVFVTIFVVLMGVSKLPFIDYDADGNPKLADWRIAKLKRELDQLDEAEQYVLTAVKNGYYPCYSCPNSTTIFLRKGEVWKYGYTTMGEKGRYQQTLAPMRLQYFTQLTGTITECMKEEKRKIYYYPLLPESIKRSIKLIRPAGNKKDF